MQFLLTLDLPDAQQEAQWLQARILDEPIAGLESEIVKSRPADGAMSGEFWTEVLKLAATTAVAESIKSLITLVFSHFKGKAAKLELAGKCPDNGQELKLVFDTSRPSSREEAIAEFQRLYADLCGTRATAPNEWA